MTATAPVLLQMTNLHTGATFPVAFYGEDARTQATMYLIRKCARPGSFIFEVVRQPALRDEWDGGIDRDVDAHFEIEAEIAAERYIAANFDEVGRRFSE